MTAMPSSERKNFFIVDPPEIDKPTIRPTHEFTVPPELDADGHPVLAERSDPLTGDANASSVTSSREPARCEHGAYGVEIQIRNDFFFPGGGLGFGFPDSLPRNQALTRVKHSSRYTSQGRPISARRFGIHRCAMAAR